ncbi:hypothetical protein BG015_001496, partial [Linnemannia schmuckeri]
GLECFTVFIAKQPGDKPEWEARVFEQISKLRRLQSLFLERAPYWSGESVRPNAVMNMETLDLRLACSRSRNSSSPSNNGGVGTGGSGSEGGDGDLSCWSSLVQLRELSFDDDRQMLGMNEVLWMVEHWRNLAWVWGRFLVVEDDDGCDMLRRVFEKNNIKCGPN